MAANDLNNPLHRDARRASRRRSVFAPALISAALLMALTAVLWVAVVDDPDGGRPVAMAVIEDVAPAATGSLADGDPLADAAAGPVSSAPSLAPGTVLAGLPVVPPDEGAFSGLLEQSAFGLLPRVAPDGRRPREAYARRSPAAVPGLPRVAIVVGGMGLSQTGTQHAIELLPEDVTLAFAPYGSSLQRWVDKARGEGHEVLLQIPLEPVGYPQESPGAHTLLVSTDRRGNRQDLQWSLGRVTSYAGVMNYMGGRFTGEEQALVPFLGEIGERGLFYLDDGSSVQSRAAMVGDALQVPVVTADAIIDRVRAPAEMQRELMALEAIARSRGVAVGVASAFPASVEAIADWARDTQERGIVIVPASAALPR